MDRSKLTDSQRKLRSNIRNAYMVATRAELERALEHHKDEFTRECIRELIAELDWGISGQGILLPSGRTPRPITANSQI